MKIMQLPLTEAFARKAARPMSRDKADTLMLLGTCALVLAPHASHLPWWIILTCSVLLLGRAWITFRGDRMPPRWLLAPIAVMTMGGVYLTHRTLLGQEAGVSMLVLLLTLKLLEMRARRDLFVVLYLSFFLVLTSFFYSQGIGTAFMTTLSVVAILTTQLSFQYTGVVPPLGRRLRLGVLILALAVPLMLVLFVLFPRIQGPLWSLPSDARSGRSGLSDTMSPGNIARLALSGEIAFRAKFFDPPPPQSVLYWRGIVLGAYDGRTWSPLKSRPNFNQYPLVKTRGEAVRYQVTLEPNGQRWLFALEAPRTIPQLAGNAARIGADMQLLARQPIRERVRYEAASHIDFDLQPNEAAIALHPWMELPPGFNPRALEFASRLRSQYGNNVDIVDAALRFFREKNFKYTLEPPALGKHVVDEFLFDTRAGFCEHYSGAFVVLMRAAGIPARVVTGYQGGEINPTDGFMEVRQSDAHAWTEVWLKGRGWVRVDPTAAVAPDRIERNLTSVIPRPAFGGLFTLDIGAGSWLANLRTLRYQWDAVSNAWNQWVLNYTPDRQRNFLKSLGFDEINWGILMALTAIAGVAVTSVVALPLVMNRTRRDPADALYETLCRQMARRGCSRSPHEGPRTYAARLTSAESPLSSERKAAVARFLESYEALRYGTAGKNRPAAIAKLKTLLANCR